jgi:vacuolar iron transporter family protein
MTLPPPSEHFGGKTVVEHLKEARTRGAVAAAEIHGVEMPGHIAAGADAARDMAIILLVLWVISPQNWSLYLLVAAGWVVWKTARCALMGWSRIERVHRLIEEERYEIEKHRDQERFELTEMYRAKGFTGKLLEDVIDVLMADDNRLLRVMLEEELGLTLESYEHPLKQASGAFIGSALAAFLLLFGLWAIPSFGLPLLAAFVVILSAWTFAKMERNKVWNAIIWNLAIAALSAGCVYFVNSTLSIF